MILDFMLRVKVISNKFVGAKLFVLHHFIKFASIFGNVNKNHSRWFSGKKFNVP
jgi:hypothetical protein